LEKREKQILHFAYPTDDESSAGPQTRSVQDDNSSLRFVLSLVSKARPGAPILTLDQEGRTLVHGGGGCGLLGAFHQEGQRDEDGGYADHDPDYVDVGEQASLDLRHVEDLCAGVVDGVW